MSILVPSETTENYKELLACYFSGVFFTELYDHAVSRVQDLNIGNLYVSVLNIYCKSIKNNDSNFKAIMAAIFKAYNESFQVNHSYDQFINVTIGLTLPAEMASQIKKTSTDKLKFTRNFICEVVTGFASWVAKNMVNEITGSSRFDPVKKEAAFSTVKAEFKKYFDHVKNDCIARLIGGKNGVSQTFDNLKQLYENKIRELTEKYNSLIIMYKKTVEERNVLARSILETKSAVQSRQPIQAPVQLPFVPQPAIPIRPPQNVVFPEKKVVEVENLSQEFLDTINPKPQQSSFEKNLQQLSTNISSQQDADEKQDISDIIDTEENEEDDLILSADI